MDAYDHPGIKALPQPLWAYDAYLEKWVWRGQFKRAFSAVFRAPERNVCFRISDWVDDNAPIAMAYRFARWRYSMKINFRMPETYQAMGKLFDLAKRLDTPIAFDIPGRHPDHVCIVLKPDGSIEEGYLVEYGSERYDGSRRLKFILNKNS